MTKVKARNRKSGKLRKIVMTGGIIAVMLIIITVSALNQNGQPTTRVQKARAADYFSFSNVEFETEESTSMGAWVRSVAFNIMPVGGKATHLLVMPTQGSVPEEKYPYFEALAQNQSVTIDVTYLSRVFSKETASGYPVYFTLSCVEAEGEVLVNCTDLW